MKFSAVILAGGRSSRMGCDKAFLPRNGRSLIQHMIEIVRQAGASEVLISGRAGQDHTASGCTVLLDGVPDGGPLAGIERSLATASQQMVLILAVDLPHMSSEFLRWLSSQCTEDRGAVPMCRGSTEPLAAFYPKQAHPIAQRLLAANQLAAREFAEACLRNRLVCTVPVPSDQEICFTNWNTPGAIRT